MTKTADSLIGRGLGFIFVKRAGRPITDDEFDDGAEDLNLMMRTLGAKNKHLGYTPVSKRDDLITTPDWSWLMMETRFAMQVAPQYGKLIGAELAALAIDAYDAVLTRISGAPKRRPDPTMPMGAGGSCGYGYRRRFYGYPLAGALLTTDGQPILDAATGEVLRTKTTSPETNQ